MEKPHLISLSRKFFKIFRNLRSILKKKTIKNNIHLTRSINYYLWY